MTKPIFRFAPSPTGFLHLGHAASALFTWQQAKTFGGTVLLRIEDIDQQRCKQEFIDQIYQDLNWLGLKWPLPVRVQSQYFSDYRKAADQLNADGLLYRCFCTRTQISQNSGHERDPDGSMIYPGTCKSLTSNQINQNLAKKIPFCLRLDLKKAIAMIGEIDNRFGTPQNWGDVVLVRKDTPTSYHLSVVVDDGLQGVTHITRGKDLYAATSIHLLLQKLLSLPTPKYFHHDLILDQTGQKLSKSNFDKSLKSLRDEGVSQIEIAELVKSCLF